RMGGLARATRSANPSTMAWRTLPENVTRVPTRIMYVGTPTSEQTRWFSASAASAASTMMRSVCLPSWTVSRRSAWASSRFVSSGTFFRDHSYRDEVTFLMISLEIGIAYRRPPALRAHARLAGCVGGGGGSSEVFAFFAYRKVGPGLA